MIMVIGGRCQGKSSFAKEHFENRVQEKGVFEIMPTGLPDWKKMAEVIYTAGPHRILVTDEIGYGIVPVDPFEREYREETGRICCLLAERSEEVWRVCCGLGTRLK